MQERKTKEGKKKDDSNKVGREDQAEEEEKSRRSWSLQRRTPL